MKSPLLGKIDSSPQRASCQPSAVRLQPGGSVGEDVSAGKPCLSIRDASVAS